MYYATHFVMVACQLVVILQVFYFNKQDKEERTRVLKPKPEKYTLDELPLLHFENGVLVE